MPELQRIEENNKSEIPDGPKTIIKVSNIANPEKVLTNCKNAVSAFLRNKQLDENSAKWESILPVSIFSFTKKLTEFDFGNDAYFSFTHKALV